jgi:hypothetical protein
MDSSYTRHDATPPSQKNTERIFRDLRALGIRCESQLILSLPFQSQQAVAFVPSSRCGFITIAICTALDGVLFLALVYRHARCVLFPIDPAKHETPRTYIDFDVLYRNGTKTGSRFPAIQALPRALGQGSSRESNKVYQQWPVSFLAPYGSVSRNDRRLLVDPEVSSVFFCFFLFII